MVLKRRSLSNVSTLSVTEKINRYHTLTDLSPDPPLIMAAPKKPKTFLKNLKKANVFNFIRKRAKTELMKPMELFEAANLMEADRFSKDFCFDSRPLSDSGIRIYKAVSFNDPKFLVFASFSFGSDHSQKHPKIVSRKDLVKPPKFIYRCILYSSEDSLGGDFEMIGCSENLILSDDMDLQFSFITPFEVRYDYEGDTTLKFELQQSRLPDKYATYSEAQNLSIDKMRRLKSPSDNKFFTIASSVCELNKLANRGFFKSDMEMKSSKAPTPTCSIYLGAEAAAIMENSQGMSQFDLQITLKQYLNNNSSEQLFTTYTPYRLMISRFFKSANAFISIYKSPQFLLTFSSSHFRAEVDGILLQQSHFLKVDSMFRFAIIEANTEKWRCYGDIPISTFSQSYVEIPITENIDPEIRQRSNIGLFKILRDLSDNRFSTASHSSSSTTMSKSPYSSRSFSVGENQRPYKISKTSAILCRAESNRDSFSVSRPVSKIEFDLNNNNNNSGGGAENKIEDNGDDDNETIIINGHTQAYLMSLLQPNKRILVREIYPGREVITEYRP